MTVLCQSRAVLCLALLGQLAATFGLPMPLLARARAGHADSACGCSPADRAAGRCCCSRPKRGARSPSAEPAAVEEPRACCAKHRAKSPKHEAPAPVTVRWVGSVLEDRCQGPLDRAVQVVAPLSFPPGVALRWSFDWAVAEMVAFESENPVARPAAPAVPPPR